MSTSYISSSAAPKFTGERFRPEDQAEHAQMTYEHLHRYHLAAEICADQDVLDIACGEGYGARLLAMRANKVVGVDRSPEIIRRANEKYLGPKLQFLDGSCEAIPLGDQSVNVVVSFETLEHITDHRKFLGEVRRVLKPGGILIISTPDKGQYTERIGNENPFHKQELYKLEFLDLLQQSFENCLLLGQRLVGGSWIAPDGFWSSVRGPLTFGIHAGTFDSSEFTPGVKDGVYSIAVCTDATLPPLKLGLFENRQRSADIWHAYEMATGTAGSQRNDGVSAPRESSEKERALLVQQESLAKKMAVLRAENEALAQRVQRSLALKSEQDKEISQLRRAVSQANKIVARQKSELDAQPIRERALNLLVAEIRQQLDEKASRLYSLTAAHTETERKNALLTQRVEDAKAEFLALAAKLAETMVERDASLAHQEVQALEFSDLQAKSAEQAHALATAVEQLKNTGGRLDAISAEMTTAKTRHEALERQLQDGLVRSRTLEKENQHLHSLSAETEEQLQAAQASYVALLGEGKKAILWASALDTDLRKDRESHEHRQAQLASKIQRMQSSISWHVTKPLRAVRRALFDPFRK